MNQEQLDQVKAQLEKAQQVSHFVIFETKDPDSDDVVRMITDYNAFQNMKQARKRDIPMKIIRDFIPITDAMARWAVAEHDAATASMGNNPNLDELVQTMDERINEVLIENKIEPNK
ncbi:hypothetical protein [Nicoliella lavandulae]|uniref:Uncharacterized protein n=1 Tax=Nicoliella lavandulae TaxID=3082954 RepID=A0ABU8SJE9_9LACO